jgi:hypothetical protein
VFYYTATAPKFPRETTDNEKLMGLRMDAISLFGQHIHSRTFFLDKKLGYPNFRIQQSGG